MNVLTIVQDSYTGYAMYLLNEITQPSWGSYFYWLIGVSLTAWLIEIVWPWRTEQKRIRKDFWLDAWYMFFNFFLFNLVVYAAASNVVVHVVRGFVIGVLDIQSLIAVDAARLPAWAQLLTFFVLRDFLQWNVHRLLHAVPWLWRFHQVHHSVEQMGFAAHLRFHWMETVVYRVLEYLPLALIGFGLETFFVAHIIALAIGHLNHSNVRLPVGPLKYVFNTPQMHIWHHAIEQPPKTKGVNFGLSLSIWDYLFGTAWIPREGSRAPLGFDGIEAYPKGFFQQLVHPFSRKR